MIKFSRFIVYPKDLIFLTGKSVRFSQRLMVRVRKKFNKSKDEPITKSEIGRFLKLSSEDLDRWHLD
ncbi:MAG TPA: hypothetical protein PLD02_13800 [Saprospiraceae bacterium]|nr:hypothetical protein [Saprospiraceae bacterium]